jgi:hypothetical protein
LRVLTDYTGRQIRLTDERVAHVLEHPEMVGLEDGIVETLVEPASVVESKSDATVDLFYRYYRRTRVGGKWLCVVVKVGVREPFVVTAYLADKVKQGSVIWQRVP